MIISPVSPVSPSPVSPVDTVISYLSEINQNAIKGKICKKLCGRYSYSMARAMVDSEDILQDILMLIFSRFDSGLRLSDIVILNCIRHYIKAQKKPMSALPTIQNDSGDYSQGDILDYSMNTLGEVLYNEILGKVGEIGEMILQGYNGKEIASTLDISEATASRRIEIAKDEIKILMGV